MSSDVRWFKESLAVNESPSPVGSLERFEDDYDLLYDGIARGLLFKDWVDDDIPDDLRNVVTVDLMRRLYQQNPMLSMAVDDAVRRGRWGVLSSVDVRFWSHRSVAGQVNSSGVLAGRTMLIDILRSVGVVNVAGGSVPDLEGWSARYDDHGITIIPEDPVMRSMLDDHASVDSWSGPVTMEALPFLHTPEVVDGSEDNVKTYSNPAMIVDTVEDLSNEESDPVSVSFKMVRRRIPILSTGKSSVVRYHDRYQPVVMAPYSRYWTAGSRSVSYPGILIDVDRDDSLDHVDKMVRGGLIPRYSWVIVNHANGHAQFCWQVPAWMLGNVSAGKLYSAASHTLRFLIGGDPCFVGSRSQNPFWIGLGVGKNRREIVIPNGEVRIYTLQSLKAWFVEHESWCPAGSMSSGRVHLKISRVDDDVVVSDDSGSDDALTMLLNDSKALDPKLIRGLTIPKGYRNTVMFRVATWLQWHGGNPEDVASMVTVQEDDGNPFNASEYASIIRKVKRYYARMHRPDYHGTTTAGTEARERCRENGRKGGLSSSPAQNKTRRKNLSAGARTAAVKAREQDVMIWRVALTSGGASNHRLSVMTGVSSMTVKRALRRIRDRVRAMMIERSKGMMASYPRHNDRSSSNGSSYEGIEALLQSLPEYGETDDWGNDPPDPGDSGRSSPHVPDDPMSSSSSSPMVDDTVRAAVRSIGDAMRKSDGNLLNARMSALGRDLAMAAMIDLGEAPSSAITSYSRKIGKVLSTRDGRTPLLSSVEESVLESSAYWSRGVDCSSMIDLDLDPAIV
jgi:hypothetical protein